MARTCACARTHACAYTYACTHLNDRSTTLKGCSARQLEIGRRMTPLHKAAVNGHAAMAKLLINNGAKLTVNDDIDG